MVACRRQFHDNGCSKEQRHLSLAASVVVFYCLNFPLAYAQLDHFRYAAMLAALGVTVDDAPDATA